MRSLEYTPIYNGEFNQLPNKKKAREVNIDVSGIIQTVLFIIASQYIIFQIIRACL